MKKGKLIKGICLVLVLVMLGFVSDFTKPVSAKEKIYEWTMISIHPKAAYPQTISYARALEKATGGAIKVKMLFAGEHPYRFEDVMTMMRDRKSDITWTGPWAVSGTEPETEILDFPFIISAGDELTALLTDPHYTERYKDVIDMAITKPLAKWNQIPLFYETRWVLGVGFDDFLDSFDSLKGKKIQAHTLGLSLFVQSMGGIPVNIPYADRYVALQRKTIVGWISAFSGSYKVRWTEVAKYFTACPVYSAPCWIVVHKDAFNELSKDLQGKVLQWAKEQQEWIHEYQNKIENDSIIEAMRRDGLRATWIDPVFSEKVRDKMKAEAWPKMIKRMRDPASVEQIIKRLDEFHIEWVKSHKK